MSSEQPGAIKPLATSTFDLGQIDGIPFCFTDAAALPDGAMVFTAVAEDTNDTYNDGTCAGAVVGIVDDELRCLHRLERPYKIEGVDVRMEGDVVKLLLVTDADDPDTPASLFSAAFAQ